MLTSFCSRPAKPTKPIHQVVHLRRLPGIDHAPRLALNARQLACPQHFFFPQPLASCGSPLGRAPHRPVLPTEAQYIPESAWVKSASKGQDLPEPLRTVDIV